MVSHEARIAPHLASLARAVGSVSGEAKPVMGCCAQGIFRTHVVMPIELAIKASMTFRPRGIF
jgi:hypothetical protein